jgi:hypothetical protein
MDISAFLPGSVKRKVLYRKYAANSAKSAEATAKTIICASFDHQRGNYKGSTAVMVNTLQSFGDYDQPDVPESQPSIYPKYIDRLSRYLSEENFTKTFVRMEAIGVPISSDRRPNRVQTLSGRDSESESEDDFDIDDAEEVPLSVAVSFSTHTSTLLAEKDGMLLHLKPIQRLTNIKQEMEFVRTWTTIATKANKAAAVRVITAYTKGRSKFGSRSPAQVQKALLKCLNHTGKSVDRIAVA